MYLPREHADAASARVTLIVVALGRTARLVDCLQSLVQHDARAPFTIVAVINPAPPSEADDRMLTERLAALGVRTLEPALNLGWAGGLHAGRRAVQTDLFVWVQDDMVVLPGWLDALVDAADAHPDLAAFGSTRYDGESVGLYNAGWFDPADDVAAWNTTDPTSVELPEGVSVFDWVTSKGLLCRTADWDAVGGPDPSFYPLTHVDKDFCVHLRAHGRAVALVPTARLRHTGNQSAPGLLREYVAERLTTRFNDRWRAIVPLLSRTGAEPVPHDCTRDRAADVEGWVAREASDIVVQFGRWAEGRRREAEVALAEARLLGHQVQAELDAVRASRSWRITAPLRALRNRNRPSRTL